MFKGIRHPIYTDAVQIARLDDETFRDHGIPYSIFFFVNSINLFNNTSLVAVDENDQVIGYLFLARSQVDPELMWALDFVVASDYRGSGVGSQLMMEMQHIVLGAKPEVKRVGLTVDPNNDKARLKYMSWGFELGEYIEDYYGPGWPRYLMHIDIEKKFGGSKKRDF